MKTIRTLGHSGLMFLTDFGAAGMMLFISILGPVSPRLLVKQLFAIGVLSLVIIMVSGTFVGSVLGLQGYNTLSKFGASEALGQLLALSILRELGPVVAALLFAGRAGSAVASEIGLMQATEQVSSMRMMGVDPLRQIIAPRFWGGFISLPLLTMIFSALAIIGGYGVGVLWLGVDPGAFWGNMQSSVDFDKDVMNGVIKSLVFGFVVVWIAVYQGYSAKPTSEGIAKATTQTVVFSSLAILGLDFFLTAMMF